MLPCYGHGNEVRRKSYGYQLLSTTSIILCESDSMSTEKGWEMYVVVYHPSTKTSLDGTLKTRRDMWFDFRFGRVTCDMWHDHKSLSRHAIWHKALEALYRAFFRLLRDWRSDHISAAVKKTLKSYDMWSENRFIVYMFRTFSDPDLHLPSTCAHNGLLFRLLWGREYAVSPLPLLPFFLIIPPPDPFPFSLWAGWLSALKTRDDDRVRKCELKSLERSSPVISMFYRRWLAV
jgi:hypothetical protein